MTEPGRDAALGEFLTDCGWTDAQITPLDGDASNRRYMRLKRGDDTRLVMDSPPYLEDPKPFVAIAERLDGFGYSAPRIEHADLDRGFLLIEDFGDQTFTRLLINGGDETALYTKAVDLLIDLHRHDASVSTADLAPYDRAWTRLELDIFASWYLPPLGQAEAAGDFHALWDTIWRHCPALPECLVLRDYHVDNLMLLDRPGLASIGLLDFQGALRGPIVYDLVSLLSDARRDVPRALAAQLKDRYCGAFPNLSRVEFEYAAAVWSAQRHLKILGIFTRLARRDGKPIYLRHIPRVWRYLDEDLAHPALSPLRRLLSDLVPRAGRRPPPMAVAS